MTVVRLRGGLAWARDVVAGLLILALLALETPRQRRERRERQQRWLDGEGG